MVSDRLLEEVRSWGFVCLEDFVRANLHYVPREREDLFVSLFGNGYVSRKYGGVYAKS